MTMSRSLWLLHHFSQWKQKKRHVGPRPAHTYRGARRNAFFHRKPRGAK